MPPLSPTRRWSLAIFLLALFAFLPALRNQFTHDDDPQVALLEIPSSPGAAILSPWWPPSHGKNLWRPLPRLTILAQKLIHPDSRAPFYAVNILLHAAAALLLFRLALRLGLSLSAAGFGALLFALHPIHAEAVHQVVGRAEILAALAIFAGLHAHLRARRPYLWQPLCLILALASKEHAVIYPFLLLLLPVRPRPRLILLLFAIILLFLAARSAITGGLIEPASTVPFFENPLAHFSAARRIPAALGLLGWNTLQLLAPVWLSPDYSWPSLPVEQGWRWPFAWLGLALLVAALGASLIAIRRPAWRLVPAFLLPWILTSNLLFPGGVNTAERIWYLPTAPHLLGLACLLTRLPKLRLLPPFYCALLLVLTLLYASAWRSEEGFARWTLSRFPDNWRGHLNLAREHYNHREFADGLEHARRATQILPNEALAYDWVGMNATFLGRYDEAEAAFRTAREINPSLELLQEHIEMLEQLKSRNK